MEKIKEFFANHKKAIIITVAVIGTAAVGAIAYKLHLDKTQALEGIADVCEGVDLETVKTVTNL